MRAAGLPCAPWCGRPDYLPAACRAGTCGGCGSRTARRAPPEPLTSVTVQLSASDAANWGRELKSRRT